MRPYRLVLAILLLLVACTGRRPSAPVSGALADTSSNDDLVVEMSCPATRQVAELSAELGATEDCPPRPGWAAEKLFQGPDGKPTGGALDRFCVYEWKGESRQPSVAALAALPGDKSPDCSVVSVEAGPPENVTDQKPQEKDYLDAIEALDSLPLAASKQAPIPVQVSVIDTALDRQPGNGRAGTGDSPHGRAVANVITRLACPLQGACLVHVVNALGLQVVMTKKGFARRPREGGHFGRIADLAKVVAERSLAVPLGTPHVLNMSIGFDLKLVKAPFGPPMRALWAALQLARCRGNLILAAAGNTAGEFPPADGALAPGVWEQQPAPDEERCDRLGVKVDDPRTLRGPILFAVAAVTNTDAPLYNTRERSRPRLAAPAQQVYIEDNAGPKQVSVGTPYTGSSFAVAGASAVAAAVWAYKPRLTPSDVIDLLVKGGVELGYPADFCLNTGQPCEEVTRLSLCRTIVEVCSPVGTRSVCHAPPVSADCPTEGAGPGALLSVGWSMDPSAVAGPPVGRSKAPSAVGVKGPDCTAATDQLNEDHVPWVGPQPGDPICVACKVSLASSGGYLEIITSAAHAGTAFQAKCMSINDENGLHWIDLGNQQWIDLVDSSLPPLTTMIGGKSYRIAQNIPSDPDLKDVTGDPGTLPEVEATIYFAFPSGTPTTYDAKKETLTLTN